MLKQESNDLISAAFEVYKVIGFGMVEKMLVSISAN